jgi:hypothetical protein
MDTNEPTNGNDLEAKVEELRHDIERLRDDLAKARRSVSASDPRVLELLKEMYDVLVNNDSSHLWADFVDSITGMPDLNRRTYGGTLTLRFHFSGVEIDGNLADWEIEPALYEAITELGYATTGDEDGYDIEYEEE